MLTVVVDAREVAFGPDRGLQTSACSRSSARPGDVWFSTVGIYATSWRNEEIYLLWLSVPVSCHKVSDQKLFSNIIPGDMNSRWERIGIVALVVGHGRLALTQFQSGARDTTRDEITLHGQDIRTNNQPAHNPMSGKREDSTGMFKEIMKRNSRGQVEDEGQGYSGSSGAVGLKTVFSVWLFAQPEPPRKSELPAKGKLELTPLFLLFPHLSTQLD